MTGPNSEHPDQSNRRTPPPTTLTVNAKGIPRKSLSTGGNHPITQPRPQIGKAMAGEFLTCPIDDFLEHYMPFAPSDDDVQKFIKENLPTTPEENSLLFFDEKNCLRFRQYTRAPAGNDREDDYYKGFETIAKKIQNYRPGNLGASEYYNCPNVALASDIAGCNNRTDACFKLRSAGKTEGNKLHVTSIAVAIEFKLHGRNKHRNDLQMLSLNTHIMNDDARRMNIPGITVESDGFTIWLHTRSHSVTSETFSFIQRPELLIKVFMAFAYATEEELGFDPMVKRNPDHSYTYEIPQPGSQSRFFRTEKYLSFYRANNITGRMTRVWLVREVNSLSNRLFVLKDVWLEHVSKTEKEIQDAIFQDIASFWGTSPPQGSNDLQRLWQKHKLLVHSGRYKHFFLNIITDYSGKMSKRISPKGKRSWAFLKDLENLLGDNVPPKTATSRLSNIKIFETSTPPRSDQSHLVQENDFERAFTPRKQYRVVYDEDCTPFGRLKTMGEVVSTLSSAVTALELLLGAGWIHRDISCGNVMVYQQDGQTLQAKLGDLEYAKRFPSDASAATAKDPKTGTPHYMAHELLTRCHLFNPGQRGLPKSYEEYSAGLDGVIHNPQHDLESLWWMGLRSVTARSQSKKTRDWAKRIFTGSLQPSPDRMVLFSQTPWRYKELVDYEIQSVAEQLESLRRALVEYYIEREKTLEMRIIHSYVEIFEVFSSSLASLEHTRNVWDKWPLVDNDKQEYPTLPLLAVKDDREELVPAPGNLESGKRSRQSSSHSEASLDEGARSGKRSRI